MIEIKKKIVVYAHLVTEIHLCDCFFDKVISLINNSENFAKNDKFINILEKEFNNEKYIITFFGGKIVMICKEVLSFILKIKKEEEKIILTHCVADFIKLEGEVFQMCTVCFIQIIQNNNFLKTFITEKKIRDETFYLYL